MNELPLYQVVDWNDHFENYKSRTRDHCSFVCVPNKHGGTGLSNLLSEPYGHGLFGLWILLLQICSRQRKPREGYLTADGRKNGRRLGADELAHTLRTEAAEVRRCLNVLSSDRVGFIRLIEGCSEKPGKAEIPEGYQKDTEGIPQYPEPDTAVSRKKEGMKEGISLLGPTESTENGIPDGYQEDTEGIPQYPTADTPVSPDGADLIQHAEAKRLFGQLSLDVFEKELRENQWSSQMEHHLDEALPLKRGDWELIAWFYGLPDDHEIFTITFRRQSIEALIENLSREMQKIRSARKKIGLNGFHEKISAADSEEWTAARREVFGRMFPGSDPGPFHLLDRDMRKQIDEKVKGGGA